MKQVTQRKANMWHHLYTESKIKCKCTYLQNRKRLTDIENKVMGIKESPLDCKEIQPVNPKGNQPWIFIGRTDAEAEAPVLWPPDVKNCLIRKDLDAGKDRRQEGGEGDGRGWDGWMPSLTQWMWVWASSGSWWRTRKPGVLQSMGLQRAVHDWVTGLTGTLKSEIIVSRYIIQIVKKK